MKLFLLICLLVTVSWSEGFVSKLDQILKMTINVSTYVSDCIDEVQGNDEVRADAVRSVDSKEDEISIQNVTQCFFMKTGILNPEGRIDTDSVHALLTLLGIDEYVSKTLLNKCTSIMGFDAEDTTFAIFKCFEDGFKDLKVF